MTIEIPESISKLSEEERKHLMIDIAMLLYDRELITLGKAAKMTGLNILEIRNELKKRNMFIHYDVEELEQDFQTVERMKWSL